MKSNKKIKMISITVSDPETGADTTVHVAKVQFLRHRLSILDIAFHRALDDLYKQTSGEF